MTNSRPIICHLLHSLNVGGAEVLAARLALRLRDSFDFVFACLDELGSLGERLQGEGFPVEVLGRRDGVDWRCVWRLTRILRRRRVEVVHAHQYTPFFYAAAARRLCRHPRVVFTEHGRHYPDYPRRKRMLANRFLLERRDCVVGVGEAVRRALIENEGIPQDRVEVVYNGVDLTPYQDDCRHDRDAVRAEIGIGPADLVLIQVARLDYLKDHATAIRALARVVQSQPNARLVLVGEGPERDAIQRSIRASNLERHVLMLGLRGDVPRLLAAADLFLLTSISEGIPLTVIEAMAAGLPVVSTRAGGVEEVVEEARSAALVPVGDDAALAREIARLASEPDLCRHMGALGRDRARALFSEGRMHARYAELYREALPDGTTAPAGPCALGVRG